MHPFPYRLRWEPSASRKGLATIVQRAKALFTTKKVDLIAGPLEKVGARFVPALVAAQIRAPQSFRGSFRLSDAGRSVRLSGSVAGATCLLDQALGAQRHMPLAADHDMVVDGDAEQAPGLGDARRDVDVGAAGFGRAGGMVVDQP